MADLSIRALVRLTDEAWLSVDEIDRALGQTRGVQTVKSPGPDETLAALQVLERRGLAEQRDDRWRQTRAGASEEARLEDAFDNSGGYGDYGF